MRLRGALVVLAAVGAMLAAVSPAAAQAPAGAIKNMEFITNLPEGRQATAINFLTYGQGSKQRDGDARSRGRFGLKTYDMADPESPSCSTRSATTSWCCRTTSPSAARRAPARTFWQNEDMDVDQRRKLAFLSRDPRAFGGSTGSNTDVAGVYIIDAKDPEDLKLVTFKQLPTGHTTSCVNDCDFLWTGGPAIVRSPSATTSAGPAGVRSSSRTSAIRPNPVSYPTQPVDLFRQDGGTAYAHDVDVDASRRRVGLGPRRHARLLDRGDAPATR